MALCEGEIPRDQLRGLRVMVGAFIAGIVIFGIIVVVIPFVREEGALVDVSRLLLVALGGLGVLEVFAYPVVRAGMRRATRKVLDLTPPEARTRTLYGSAQGLTLLGAAMAEGFGLFGCVLYLMGREPLALLAPLIAVALLALSFPDERRLRDRMCYLEGVEPRMVLD